MSRTLQHVEASQPASYYNVIISCTLLIYYRLNITRTQSDASYHSDESSRNHDDALLLQALVTHQQLSNNDHAAALRALLIIQQTYDKQVTDILSSSYNRQQPG